MHQRFGQAPFEHHAWPDEHKDFNAYQGHGQDRQDHPPPDFFGDNHRSTGQDAAAANYKDPQVWDPPTPPKNDRKKAGGKDWGGNNNNAGRR